MDTATTALVRAAQAALPSINASEVAAAVLALVQGYRPTGPVTLTIGDANTFTQSNMILGSFISGNVTQTVQIMLPQPLDPLPAALALFASIPTDTLPRQSTHIPQHSRITLPCNPHFVGRESELLRLAQAIYNPDPTILVPAVATGIGGIGKTNLATEFLYRYGRYFAGGVFWINCADPALISTEVVACGHFSDFPALI